jgi:hypothetical protein
VGEKITVATTPGVFPTLKENSWYQINKGWHGLHQIKYGSDNHISCFTSSSKIPNGTQKSTQSVLKQ